METIYFIELNRIGSDIVNINILSLYLNIYINFLNKRVIDVKRRKVKEEFWILPFCSRGRSEVLEGFPVARSSEKDSSASFGFSQSELVECENLASGS